MHTFNQSKLSRVQIWIGHGSLIEDHFKVEFPAKRENRAQKFRTFLSLACKKCEIFAFSLNFALFCLRKKREVGKRNTLLWYNKTSKAELSEQRIQQVFSRNSLRFRIYWLNFSKYESFCSRNTLLESYIKELCYTYTACSDNYRNGLNWLELTFRVAA